MAVLLIMKMQTNNFVIGACVNYMQERYVHTIQAVVGREVCCVPGIAWQPS